MTYNDGENRYEKRRNVEITYKKADAYMDLISLVFLKLKLNY